MGFVVDCLKLLLTMKQENLQITVVTGVGSIPIDSVPEDWSLPPLWRLRSIRMATTLAPVDSREVVRCDDCHLVQFRTSNNICRRCKTLLDAVPEVVHMQAPATITPTVALMPSNQLPVAAAIRSTRMRAGLSQRQLALRMSVPRTYVSKIENEKACPTLGSLERLAGALRVRVSDLLTMGRTTEDDIRELSRDEFISELMPYMRRLNGVQWTSVLNQVRELTAMPRRTA
jgi:transcriptional regulator with XRE-family HTH domain